jgi:hypothetical protein
MSSPHTSSPPSPRDGAGGGVGEYGDSNTILDSDVTARSASRQHSLDAAQTDPPRDSSDAPISLVVLSQQLAALTNVVQTLLPHSGHVTFDGDPKPQSSHTASDRDQKRLDAERRRSTNKLMNDIPRNAHHLFAEPRSNDASSSSDDGAPPRFQPSGNMPVGRRITDPFQRPARPDGVSIHEAPTRPMLECSGKIANAIGDSSQNQHMVPTMKDLDTFKTKIEQYRRHNGIDPISEMLPESFIQSLEARYDRLNQARHTMDLTSSEYESLLLTCVLARIRPQTHQEAITAAKRIKMTSSQFPSMDNLVPYVREWTQFIDLVEGMDPEDRPEHKTFLKMFLSGLQPPAIRTMFERRHAEVKYNNIASLAEEIRLQVFSLEEKSRVVAPFFKTDKSQPADSTKKDTGKKDKQKAKDKAPQNRGQAPTCKSKGCNKTCPWNPLKNEHYAFCSKACMTAKPPPGPPQQQALNIASAGKKAQQPKAPQCARKGCSKDAAPRAGGGFHAHCSMKCYNENPDNRGAGASPICYKCKQPGHRQADCPNSNANPQNFIVQNSSGQLFTLTPAAGAGGVAATNSAPSQMFAMGNNGNGNSPPSSVLGMTPCASVTSYNTDARIAELEEKNRALQALLHQSAQQMGSQAQAMSMSASHC